MTDFDVKTGIFLFETDFKDDDITGFGSIIEKIDFNDDGHLDLVIGAPLFYKVEHGSKSGTEGAVYIYLNDGQGGFTPEPVWTMYGGQGSRFGAELHNIGDITSEACFKISEGYIG